MSALVTFLAGRVVLDAQACDWEDAVRSVGAVLERAGDVKPCYVEAMVRTVRELGPYAVIAPGVAMPHARPEDGVVRTAMAFARLLTPVTFGNEVNDPVDLLFAFATRNSDEHVGVLSELARFLAEPDRIEALRKATCEEDVWTILRLGEPAGQVSKEGSE